VGLVFAQRGAALAESPFDREERREMKRESEKGEERESHR
jgi:hypothetical protein